MSFQSFHLLSKVTILMSNPTLFIVLRESTACHPIYKPCHNGGIWTLDLLVSLIWHYFDPIELPPGTIEMSILMRNPTLFFVHMETLSIDVNYSTYTHFSSLKETKEIQYQIKGCMSEFYHSFLSRKIN